MLFPILTTILGLTIIVLLVAGLRSRGVFREEHAGFVNDLLVRIVLPASILHEVMNASLKWAHLKMSLSLALVSLGLLALAWALGRAMGLARPVLGAFMLSSSFSATALIGLPVIRMLHPGDASIQADAIMASEFGMIVPAMILGPILAQVFGESEAKEPAGRMLLRAMRAYATSPIGLALWAGIAISVLDLRAGTFLETTVDRLLQAAASGLSILPLVLLGLILKPKSIRGLWPVVLAALALQTVAEPMLGSMFSRLWSLTAQEREVMLILGMTPAALLTPAFTVRHRCAPEVAAAITFASMVASLVMFPLMFRILG